MKNTRYKQVACISTDDPATFQQQANAILSHTPQPEIIMDPSKPFTMYIIYDVSRREPETFLELLSLMDPGETTATCSACPAFVPDPDKRRKRGRCQFRTDERSRTAPACEFYYMKRRDGKTRIMDELKQLPYLIED